MQELRTVDEVIAAVGGPSAAAKLAGRTPQNVWGWRAEGRFPSKHYLKFSEELKARGMTAPPSLWGLAES